MTINVMTDERVKHFISLFIFTIVYYMPNCIFEISVKAMLYQTVLHTS